MLSLSCCYLLASLQHKSSLSAPMATWSRHSRSEKLFQYFGLDVCDPVQTLFQALSLLSPGTAITCQKIGSSCLAWIYAVSIQPCSKLCHLFRATTAAYGQNTAFMAILGPSQPLGPPETVTPGPKKCTSSLAWVYAIPFKPCSKL